MASRLASGGLEGGDNQTPAGNNTFLLSDLDGLDNAGELSLVVNVAEPGNDNEVVLTDLYMSLYSTTGSLLRTFFYTGIDLTITGHGVGTAGLAFTLDDAQAALAVGDCSVLTECVVAGGVQFANGSTFGSLETVYVRSIDRQNGGDPGGEIPEPGTLALLGLVAAAFGLRRVVLRK